MQPLTREMKKAYDASLRQHIENVWMASEKLGIKVPYWHDESKRSRWEFDDYVRQFFGPKDDPAGFAMAWLHHIHNNPHHWQYWIFPDGYNPDGANLENGIMRMPREHYMEMIADWMGASKTYTGEWDISDWLSKNVKKIHLHSETARNVLGILDALGYADIIYSPGTFCLGEDGKALPICGAKNA